MIEVVTQTSVQPPQDFWGLVYFAAAALMTIGVETLRRYIKHRMDIWESKHPIENKRKGRNDE